MSEVVGIICGGGTVPGLNSLVSSVVLSAREAGLRVLGFHDGFLHLASGDPNVVRQNVVDLTDHSLASDCPLIRTNRFDPSRSFSTISNCTFSLSQLNIRYLLVIGGNTQLLASQLITDGADPTEMQILILPKTVDNDVPLPDDALSFGFHSARVCGHRLVSDIVAEAHRAHEWVIVETSGRRTGHLPFELARSGGAALLIIPEDFAGRKLDIGDVCDLLEGSILKSLALSRPGGVCVVAEGVVNQMSAASINELARRCWVPRGPDGVDLGAADLSGAIADEVAKRFAKRGIDLKVTARSLVADIRSAPPTDFEIDYGRALGRGTIQGFLAGHSNCVVFCSGGEVEYLSFQTVIDADTGRLIPRRVDVKSAEYTRARRKMCLIDRADLDDDGALSRLAEVGNCDAAAIVAQFGRVAKGLYGSRRLSDQDI
jgi:6-phosphofructokinase 1